MAQNRRRIAHPECFAIEGWCCNRLSDRAPGTFAVYPNSRGCAAARALLCKGQRSLERVGGSTLGIDEVTIHPARGVGQTQKGATEGHFRSEQLVDLLQLGAEVGGGLLLGHDHPLELGELSLGVVGISRSRDRLLFLLRRRQERVGQEPAEGAE